MRPLARHPLVWILLIALTCCLGIGSRRHAAHLPEFVVQYTGDTCWALALFLVLGLVLPRASSGRIAALTLAGSFLVEVSQLYHAPWIEAVRQTTLGGLVLGFGFLWSDLACYVVGIGLGILVEWGLSRAQRLWAKLPTWPS
jgi:hypothetical protein